MPTTAVIHQVPIFNAYHNPVCISQTVSHGVAINIRRVYRIPFATLLKPTPLASTANNYNPSCLRVRNEDCVYANVAVCGTHSIN